NGFIINRVPRGRGWYPIVTGAYIPLEHGTKISVTTRSTLLNSTGFIVIFAILMVLWISTILSGEFFVPKGYFLFFLGGIVGAMVWDISMFIFHYEVDRTVEFLQDVLKAHSI